MSSTYRLQLHARFTFADAAAQVDQIARLGVTHLYLSPVLQAAPGSTHGYDVLDHTRVGAELGGRDGLEALAGRARRAGLGLLVDVVPNHMAFTAPEPANAPLWQTLREGQGSPTAHWFDVDWTALDGRLGVPVLGGTLAETLAAGELVLDRHGPAGEPVVRYHDHAFPVAPGTGHEDVRRVLERQHYLLASWREADAVLNYRRFFDVTSLIAVRVELPDVFEATHRLLLSLHHAGVVDGFRIDHPDGLADPTGYLQRLHDACRPGTPVYVEKILEGAERLPADWACEGTTGYDAAAALALALAPAEPAAVATLDRTWAATGGEPDEHRAVAAAKRHVVAGLLRPEARRLLARAAEALPEADPARLGPALDELLVAGDVYRAYVRPPQPATGADLAVLDRAAARAVAARPDLAGEVRALAGLAAGTTGSARPASAADFAVRLQQTWGPVMAKGIEDTTFYRWHRLAALNEVGGDPAGLGAGPERLHGWAAHQQAAWPRGMTALSTHDTKRSEDVRARLLAVAADPGAWQRCSAAFAEAADSAGIDRPTAHLLWQTLVGAGPLPADRLHGYLTKAVREAKQHTSWTDPDPGYEAAVLALADRACEPGPLADAVAEAVAANRDGIRALVLGQKALQLLLPGCPDVYQGTELVDLSLVDPDNRRPVDFAERGRRLARLGDRGPGDLDQDKLRVVTACLALRRECPDAFGAGAGAGYRPLRVGGGVGFVRGGQVACAAQTADGARGPALDGTTGLPPGSWRDRLSGETHAGEVPGRALFAALPVAVLVREGA